MLPFRVLARIAAMLAVAAILAPSSRPALAQPALDRPAVEAIVKEYLMQHPEVIEDAMNELQARRVAAESERQKKALAENRDQIVSAPQNVVLGNPDGDVTLVEFFDYNCGYCKRGLADMLGLLDKDKKLKVVLKDYPILSPGSIEAAAVAQGVKKQLKGDKFLEFHKALLMSRGPVAKDRAIEVAKDAGVDMTKLETDVNDTSVKTAIGENLRLGETLGVSGTPSYVLAGELVSGAVGYDALKTKIDAVRKCGATLC
jgi:protein-disulfide isomerase